MSYWQHSIVFCAHARSLQSMEIHCAAAFSLPPRGYGRSHKRDFDVAAPSCCRACAHRSPPCRPRHVHSIHIGPGSSRVTLSRHRSLGAPPTTVGPRYFPYRHVHTSPSQSYTARLHHATAHAAPQQACTNVGCCRRGFSVRAGLWVTRHYISPPPAARYGIPSAVIHNSEASRRSNDEKILPRLDLPHPNVHRHICASNIQRSVFQHAPVHR
ncbi:hypothetical protein FA95DRAFT_128683 [Auriscalpium vulgare]|uniref:Uncharacterized protein n=1 Tax=Auriscalpium vulgare TaxID=40419 RepID=A0ACB8RNV9_9AGAM|nr:hypothetical protein FA95DRAFT_128683 [Auriscalpium vulgare]